jgi:CheY-like chemotaxis protein
MQGEIGFDSRDGEGTEFWFTAKLQLSTQQAQKLSLNKDLLFKRVLIVGCNGGVLDALVSQLSSWEMVVESIQNTSDVQTIIQEAQQAGRAYDLIFINMPVLQAIDLSLLSSLANSDSPEKPFVIVLASLAQRADALRTGMDNQIMVEWLSKPLTREKLCRALINCFGLDQPEDGVVDKNEPGNTDVIGRRILLVEDNAVNQMVAKGMLNKLGYIVTSVVNGKEALGMLEEKEFDLILMDCLMPVLDGYETTRAWRQNEEGKSGRLPIIAMTASVVEGEHQRCLSCGMDDYLSKPVNLEELSAKMRQWLGAASVDAPDTIETGSSQLTDAGSSRKSA